ncbi:MAG: uridine diphosphate-N-acetylglucosamine-binding protein YvcK [Candidatus Omnitrophota bacterium]
MTRSAKNQKAACLVISDRDSAREIASYIAPLGQIVITADNERASKRAFKRYRIKVALFDDDAFSRNGRVALCVWKAIKRSGTRVMVISSRRSPRAILEARDAGAHDYLLKPFNRREFLARYISTVEDKIRITCLGGGTGLFHILLGMKHIPGILLTACVSTSDDGGSSGRLKASFGILPPGDVRRCLVALSNAPEMMNQVMGFRFERGDGIQGHSFGNLFLTALSEIKGSLPEAVRALSDILNVQGIVLPISHEQTTLCARFEDGTVVRGESKIDTCEDRHPGLHISEIWHEPEVKCAPDAFAAIVNSDLITIGPGDLFTSVVTNLMAGNIRKALFSSRGKRVYLCNLMTKPGETARYTAFDHVGEIVKYMGRDCLDYVLISDTKLSGKSIRAYAKKEQQPVSSADVERLGHITSARVISADVGHETELVRHDSEKVKTAIIRILKREKTAP